MLTEARCDPMTIAMVADDPTLPPEIRAALHTADDI